MYKDTIPSAAAQTCAAAFFFISLFFQTTEPLTPPAYKIYLKIFVSVQTELRILIKNI